MDQATIQEVKLRKKPLIRNFLIPIEKVDGIPGWLKQKVLEIFTGLVYIISLPQRLCGERIGLSLDGKTWQPCRTIDDFFMIISEDGKTAFRFGQGCKQHGFLPQIKFSCQDLLTIIEMIEDGNEQKKHLLTLIKKNIRSEPSLPKETTSRPKRKTTEKTIVTLAISDDEEEGEKLTTEEELDFTEDDILLPEKEPSQKLLNIIKKDILAINELPLPDLDKHGKPLEKPMSNNTKSNPVDWSFTKKNQPKVVKIQTTSSKQPEKGGETMEKKTLAQRQNEFLDELKQWATTVKPGERIPADVEKNLRDRVRHLGFSLAEAHAKAGLSPDALGIKCRTEKKQRKESSEVTERKKVSLSTALTAGQRRVLDKIRKKIEDNQTLCYRENYRLHLDFGTHFRGQQIYQVVKELGGDPDTLGLTLRKKIGKKKGGGKVLGVAPAGRKKAKPLNFNRLDKSHWPLINGFTNKEMVVGRGSRIISLPPAVVGETDGRDHRLLIHPSGTRAVHFIIVQELDQPGVTNLLEKTKTTMQEEMVKKLMPVNEALDFVRKAHR